MCGVCRLNSRRTYQTRGEALQLGAVDCSRRQQRNSQRWHSPKGGRERHYRRNGRMDFGM